MSRRSPISVRAFAKINITLRVLGVRPDGYHDLRTVFQSLELHDRLTFELEPGPFAITCDDPTCPTDRRNLVWRAAELVWRAAGRRGPVRDVRVCLEKGIPAQAGLGGGSSDAAATLRALAHLWRPDLAGPDLVRLGRILGADVPFFLLGGTALGVERGDRLFPLADAPPAWVVLARPDFGVSTADAYRWFDERTGGDGRAATQGSGGPYDEGGNDLEAAVMQHHPTVGRLIRGLRRRGAHWAAMSGSGSVCYGLFASRREARAAAMGLRSGRVTTVVTKTLSAREYADGARPVRGGRRSR